MSVLAVQTEGLTKIYKGELGHSDVLGLENLNLQVEAGEVFAFLGPNGAGKTTTIKLITRLLHPTRGKAWIFGDENTSRLSMIHVGYLPEQPQLYGYLNGIEFLDYMARIFGLNREVRNTRIPELIDKVGLKSRADTAIRGYSRGMMQRLGLAQALINDPQLLILDEPMASLDPVGRKDFRDLILEIKEQGKTIFFSSHILSDAEMIADRVGILNQGKLVSVGRLDDMAGSQTTAVEVTFEIDDDQKKRIDLSESEMVIQGSKVMTRLQDEAMIPDMLKRIEKWGGRLISVIPQKKSLEEVFIDKLEG